MLIRKRTPSPTWTAFVALGLSMGCSLRDLDYLQDGETSTSTDSLGPEFPTTGTSTSASGTSTSVAGSDTTQGQSTSTSTEGEVESEGEGSGSGTGIATVDSSGGDSSGGGSTTLAEDDETSDATSTSGGTQSAESTSEESTSGSTGTVPPDGNYIVNGSFEQGYLGWVIDPPSAQGEFAFIQWPPGGSTTPDGQNEMSTWSDEAAWAVYVYQEIQGIPDGFYTFTGNFNRGDGHNSTQLFARNCGGEDVFEDIPLTAPSEWLEFSITGIEVIGGACEVGFFVDSPVLAWFNSDLFSFVADPE